MREFVFRSMRPTMQLWILLLLSFGSMLLFTLLSSQLAQVFFGLDLLNDPNALTHLEDPNAVSAHRFLLIIQHIGVFILPALTFNQLFTFRDLGSFLHLDQQRVGLLSSAVALIAVLSAYPMVNLLYEWVSQINFTALGETGMVLVAEENRLQRFTDGLLVMHSAADLWMNLFVFAFIPAVGEELMFRGVLQKILARVSASAHVGVWLSALIFSALHFQAFGFVSRLLLGAGFGYLLLATGSIRLVMAAHFANNALAVGLSFAEQRGWLATASQGDIQWSQWPVLQVASATVVGALAMYIGKHSTFAKRRQAYLFVPSYTQSEPDE